MKNITKDEKYTKSREEKLEFVQERFKTDTIELFHSPFSKYKLIIENYELDGQFDITRGIIVNESDSNYRVEINRNYGSFLFQWILKDSKEYLLCGQDYQGYTIVDLENQEIIDYVPEGAYKGMGFCWAAIHQLQNSNVLVVEGCYWADEYEIVFYDFSNPLELPYNELKRISPYEEIKGWKEQNLFEYMDEERILRQVKIY